MESVRPTVRSFYLLAWLILSVGLLLDPSSTRLQCSEARQPIIVELSGLPPTAAAAEAARRDRRPFDRALHERSVIASQQTLLASLRRAGIDFRVTQTPMGVAGTRRSKPNQFASLINAVGLDVPTGAIEAIRGMPGVRRVTLDRPLTPALADSVPYIRGSDGPGLKTIFRQNGGTPLRFDGTGQVIAIFDSGIDASHPMFDTRYDDSGYLSRTGDLRPVRLAGEMYIEGVNHPKVAYFLTVTATANSDDGGHGTACASHSAGVKVKGPGLDRIPGNTDDAIVEGVAPGALLMNYKVCEGILTCVGTTNLITALEDALSPTDPAGNPKPVATVINMSFGGSGGDSEDATAVAASNAALAGAVVIASAGNSGPGENTLGSPAAGRRVIGVGASIDPGEANNELDILTPDPLRYTMPVLGTSTGAQNDTGRSRAAADRFMKAIIMGGAPQVAFPLGQQYIYGGLADTPDQIPVQAYGRIVLASRGSTASAGGESTGLFANKAAEAAAKGAVALLVFNNVDQELEAAGVTASAIPVFGLSKANGEYLRDVLGFESPTFDKNNSSTWATLSRFPLRINLPDPATFSPSATSFSSRGPVDNFRYLKPDVIAPGQNVYGATVAAGGIRPTDQASMFDPSRFINASGTSFSAPHVAGSAALIREALLVAKGMTPIDSVALRSGSAASTQAAQDAVATVSLVRSALTNTATSLREADRETTLPDGDSRNFIHAIGAGLVHLVRAADARAVMGTNDANGAGGPDDASDPDFLPTYSFGENAVIDTGVASQTRSITVTLENAMGSGGGGTYSLSLLDGGAGRGNVTRPISGTPGFSVGLTSFSVALGAAQGSRSTFDVTVTVDGRPAPIGLARAGIDVTGREATEFLWWVVARSDTGRTLRMPFYYRAAATAALFSAAPFQNAIQDDATPDQVGGVDRDGSYRLSWTYPGPPAEVPCGFQVEESATPLVSLFSDDGSEPLLAGANSKWAGAAEWNSSLHPQTMTPGYAVAYHDQLDAALTMTSAIALPPDTKIQLSFDAYQDLEDGFDYGFVDVSVDGSAFLTLASYTGAFTGPRTLDLSRFAGRSVKIRFRVVSDLLISTPAYLGWLLDNIAIQAAPWTVLGTTDAATLAFDVSGRATGDYLYRIAGRYGAFCNSLGAYSNLRLISVQRDATPPMLAPTAEFTASPNPARVGETITFNASASRDHDAVGCDPASDGRHCIARYYWTFGDGTSLDTTQAAVSHAYAAPGAYRVSLTVTDDDAQTGSAEQTVEVSEPAAPQEEKVTGGGWIASGAGKANFGFAAEQKGVAAPTGNLSFDDKPGKTKVIGESITDVTVAGSRARITGTCSINKVSGFTFVLEVTDNGEPGSTDFLHLELSNGYLAEGTLGAGNIKVHAAAAQTRTAEPIGGAR